MSTVIQWGLGLGMDEQLHLTLYVDYMFLPSSKFILFLQFVWVK